MTKDPDRFEHLQNARHGVIHQLTELNARHISSQGQMSGIELNLNRCREALDSGDTSEDFVSSIARYEREYEAVVHARNDIDRQRDALNDELLAIDGQIRELD